MTLTVEEADYKENVEKTLKNYRKRANVPGFRPGMVPMGMIKKQFGTTAKVDEINKLLGEEIYKMNSLLDMYCTARTVMPCSAFSLISL